MLGLRAEQLAVVSAPQPAHISNPPFGADRIGLNTPQRVGPTYQG
jgi:hypothetical protein